VAYAAKRGDKWLAVVDGQEGPEYEGISVPIFSPNSQRVAYAAKRDNKPLVVVDGQEGPEYDGIVKRGKILWDSADQLHYLANKGNAIYLVEESFKE
jgi:hypothetical protein